MFKRRFLSLLAAATLTGLMGCSPDKPAFKGVDITGADYAKDFALTDQNGRTVSGATGPMRGRGAGETVETGGAGALASTALKPRLRFMPSI